MTELNLEIAEEVAKACKAASDDIAGALGRALGGLFGLEVGACRQCQAGSLTESFDGAGLTVLVRVGDTGMAIVLPQSSQFLPEWCAAPDASGISRLKTLAQELSTLVLPAQLEASDFNAAYLGNVASALVRGGLADNVVRLEIDLTGENRSGQLSLLWPLSAPGELLEPSQPAEPPTAANGNTSDPCVSGPSFNADKPRDLAALPGYSRSLLKISVPVSVQLAGKKESIQEVISLAPGSIIKFEKGCEELLQLIVGDHTIAEGEAVKIGEKFGFRVTSMKLPPEHFVPVRKARRA